MRTVRGKTLIFFFDRLKSIRKNHTCMLLQPFFVLFIYIYFFFPYLISFNLLLLQIEVFNILFIREQEKRHVVHCMDCARKQAPSLEGFVCLEEYRMRDLMDVYDGFTLHTSLNAPSLSGQTSQSS